MTERVRFVDRQDGSVYDEFDAGRYNPEAEESMRSILQGALEAAGMPDPRIEAIIVPDADRPVSTDGDDDYGRNF